MSLSLREQFFCLFQVQMFVNLQSHYSLKEVNFLHGIIALWPFHGAEEINNLCLVKLDL